MTPNAIKDRLAGCIYFADMELQGRPSVLWTMLPVSQQIWYVNAAAKVLKHAATRKVPSRPPRQKL
jgi:hypothetical protein